MYPDHFLDHEPILNEMGTPREFAPYSVEYILALRAGRGWTQTPDGDIVPGIIWPDPINYTPTAYYITNKPVERVNDRHT
jgi:hypothetical protein